MPPKPKPQQSIVWLAFMQLVVLLVLISPGVWYVGSAYAVVSQTYVLLCVLIPGLPKSTAARLNTAVAIANILLSIMVWHSAVSLGARVGAAYRSAVVCAVGVAMISSSEYLRTIAGVEDE